MNSILYGLASRLPVPDPDWIRVVVAMSHMQDERNPTVFAYLGADGRPSRFDVPDDDSIPHFLWQVCQDNDAEAALLVVDRKDDEPDLSLFRGDEALRLYDHLMALLQGRPR